MSCTQYHHPASPAALRASVRRLPEMRPSAVSSPPKSPLSFPIPKQRPTDERCSGSRCLVRVDEQSQFLCRLEDWDLHKRIQMPLLARNGICHDRLNMAMLLEAAVSRSEHDPDLEAAAAAPRGGSSSG